MAFLFGVFCKVVRKYSVGVSFGCDLAPLLLEEKGGLEREMEQTIQGGISREINTSSTKESWAVGKRMRGGCGMQAEEAGYLRH